MCRYALTIFVVLFCLQNARADESSGSSVFEALLVNDPVKANSEPARVPEPSGPVLPRQRLALGVNYTGGQIRWRLSPRWAFEGRAQFGNAESNVGKVHSEVFGLRGYRFYRLGQSERA